MATIPVDELKIIERYGPHLNRMAGDRSRTDVEPDRLVKTHCCFCGQQCGIQLKVKDNIVIGFEPWEEFPFNRGMLCPKGVKRYLQGAHPDRLLTAVRRDPADPSGFSAMPYGEAIRYVASQIDRSQHKNRATAMGMLKARLYEAELQKREAEASGEYQAKTEIGWGHQIRSYVLQPYQLVKDLRTGVTSTAPGDVLDGALDPFMAAALSQKVTGEKVEVEDID